MEGRDFVDRGVILDFDRFGIVGRGLALLPNGGEAVCVRVRKLARM